MVKVTAIVLAAGLSRRMGKENKLFLRFNETTIIDTVVRQIIKTRTDQLVIVGSELSLDRLKQYQSDNILVVDNPEYETGMTSSIKAGVQTAGICEGYMISLGDQPMITTGIYDQIIDSFVSNHPKDTATITVPYHKGKKGNPVIFSSHYRHDILSHTEPEGCKEIVQAHKSHINKIEISSSSILVDIDTREEYERL